MISPHTPPGTEVVAVCDWPSERGLPQLHKGRVYTVERIVRAEVEPFGVVLREHGLGLYYVPPPWWAFWRSPDRKRSCWSLTAFRYLDKAARPEFYVTKAPVRRDEKVAG